MITLAGIPFGTKIGGRFAVTNVFQILGFIMLMPDMLRHMTSKFIMWVLLLLASQVFSAFIMSIVYNETSTLRIAHIGFFTLMGTYIAYFVNRLNYGGGGGYKRTIETVYKLTIIPFFVYFSAIGYHNAIHRILISNFGFDDKSHAVFFCAFYAFLALKLLRGKYRFVVSAIFMILSLMTISRLVIFFLPFYIFMFCKYAFNMKNAAYKILIVTFLLVAVLFVAYQSSSFFHVFRRAAGGASGSTRGHLDLINAALELKIDSVWNFVFGIGPGNFGGLLTMTDIKSYLNTSIHASYSEAVALIPAHTTHIQIFLEFSIVIFIAYFWFIWRIFTGNLKRRNLTELCFYIPLMTGVFFYSTHNEVLYWMMLLYLFAEGCSTSQ